MARRYLSALLLLLCAACATPHDLVRVKGVEPEQVCAYLRKPATSPGGCVWMDRDEMAEAIRDFQQSQHLTPADGTMNGATWMRLKTVVDNGRKLRATQTKTESTSGGQSKPVPPRQWSRPVSTPPPPPQPNLPPRPGLPPARPPPPQNPRPPQSPWR